MHFMATWMTTTTKMRSLCSLDLNQNTVISDYPFDICKLFFQDRCEDKHIVKVNWWRACCIELLQTKQCIHIITIPYNYIVIPNRLLLNI
jgi:hypothetical protein